MAVLFSHLAIENVRFVIGWPVHGQWPWIWQTVSWLQKGGNTTTARKRGIVQFGKVLFHVPIMEPYGGYTYTETSPSFSCVFSAKDCRRYCLVAIVAIVIRSYEKWVGWKVEGQELEIGTIPQVVRWWLRKQVPSSLDIRWIVWGPKVLGTTVAAEYVYTCIYIYISCYFLYYA